MNINKIINNIINLIFPPVCGFCNEINNKHLCENCKNKIEKLKNSNIQDYSKVPVFFNEHYYLFKYENEIREFIIKYKFEEKSYLYKTFSKILVDDTIFREKFIKNYDCIISVPIHKKRMKTRGYNQSDLIAKEVALTCGIQYMEKVLIKNKNIIPQSSLDMLGRIKNIKDAFSIGNNIDNIKGKKVAVFDDIFTTGSTVNECAKLLKNAGVSNVGIFTFAKD